MNILLHTDFETCLIISLRYIPEVILMDRMHVSIFVFKMHRLKNFFLYSRFLLAISYMLVYVCQSQSPNSSPYIPPLVSIHLFSTSVSLFLPCNVVHLYHFSRFHIYVLMYDICFSLSDLLCMTGSRSIHVSTNDTISFLFIAE